MVAPTISAFPSRSASSHSSSLSSSLGVHLQQKHEDHEFVTVLGDALKAAKRADAQDTITRSNASSTEQATSSSSSNATNRPKFYMISSSWMGKLNLFLELRNGDKKPSKIINSSLLQQHEDSISGNSTTASTDIMGSSNTSQQSQSSTEATNGSFIVVDDPLQIISKEGEEEKGQIDNITHGDTTATTATISTNLVINDKNTTIRPRMKHLQDYHLVGEAQWTVLSQKFGYDTILPFSAQNMTSEQCTATDNFVKGGKALVVVVYPELLVNTSTPSMISVEERKAAVVPILDLQNGMYKYTLAANDDYQDDDDDEVENAQNVTDLFPDMDEEDDAGTPPTGSEPILLLPPSTTSYGDTTLEGGEGTGHSNSMLVDKVAPSPTGSASSSTRKRKRYGAGLGNLGNTCFMNSTLQCLAHTPPIRQYFLSGEYVKALNRENPLGTGGELATEFASLLSQMWGTAPSSSSSTYGNRNSYNLYGNTVYPRSFKSTLGRHAEQFIGYNQHDSQELATYLLDALHEDTNRVTKKPYIEKPEQGEGESDDIAAQKAWDIHLKRENSQILENLMGQVKSRVECPTEHCGRVSTTFDPFMYLSVPLPGESEKNLFVSFTANDFNKCAVKLKITINKNATINDLKHKVADAFYSKKLGRTDVIANDIVIADVYSEEVFSFLHNDDSVDKISDNDTIVAFEVASSEYIHSQRAKIDEEERTRKLPDQSDPQEKISAEDLLNLNEVTKVNQNWRTQLESYMRKPPPLINLLNSKYSSNEDRFAFQKRANDFLAKCYSSSEFQEHLNGPINTTSTSSSTDDDIILKESDQHNEDVEVESSTSNTTSGSFADALTNSRPPSLKTLSEQSMSFKNVEDLKDIAMLEACIAKFNEVVKQEITKKHDKFADGLDVQVVVRKPSISQFTSGSTNVGVRVIRIAPNTSVFDLRKTIAEQFSPFLHSNEAMSTETETETGDGDSFLNKEEKSSAKECFDALSLIQQVPLTFKKKTSYSSVSGSDGKQLGSVPPSSFGKEDEGIVANPNDEEERKYILDIVGEKGKVYLTWSKDLFKHFDGTAFVKEEDRSSPEDEDEDNGSQKTLNVLDCIKRYCQVEQLEETEMWYCNQCKDHVRAWKQFHLYRTPKILIIHLKRFHYSSATHRRNKIDTFVDFPLRGLDLREEVMSWEDGEEPIYDCYAVSNHYGGLGGGHYTAYAQNDDEEWSYFDDSRVTTGVDEKEVVSAAAYVLYYKRRDLKSSDASNCSVKNMSGTDSETENELMEVSSNESVIPYCDTSTEDQADALSSFEPASDDEMNRSPNIV